MQAHRQSPEISPARDSPAVRRSAARCPLQTAAELDVVSDRSFIAALPAARMTLGLANYDFRYGTVFIIDGYGARIRQPGHSDSSCACSRTDFKTKINAHSDVDAELGHKSQLSSLRYKVVGPAELCVSEDKSQLSSHLGMSVDRRQGANCESTTTTTSWPTDAPTEDWGGPVSCDET